MFIYQFYEKVSFFIKISQKLTELRPFEDRWLGGNLPRFCAMLQSAMFRV